MKLLLHAKSKSITVINFLTYLENVQFISDEPDNAVIVGVNESGKITLENTTDQDIEIELKAN